MDAKKISYDYAFYYSPLQLMGEMSLKQTPCIGDLNVSTVKIQTGYKEIKETNFDGSFTDFLCLVSLRWVIQFNVMWDEKHQGAVKNALRLVIRRPEYYFNEMGMEFDEEAYAKLAKLYLRLYQM